MEKFDKKAIDAKVAAGFPLTDRWHNRFHLEMPFGLINDPNGMTFANGEYHIFYQWNPLGCEHKNKCWAHVKTRDFVHYSLPELSLWPSDEHDKDGCYSGCGFTEKGEVRVFYTCNAKNDGVRTPAQRLGTLQADGHVEKDATRTSSTVPASATSSSARRRTRRSRAARSSSTRRRRTAGRISASSRRASRTSATCGSARTCCTSAATTR